MSVAEIHAAALSDSDAQPLTAERLAGMKQTPRLKIIRRALICAPSSATQPQSNERFAQRHSLGREANRARDRRLRPTVRRAFPLSSFRCCPHGAIASNVPAIKTGRG